MKYLCIVLCMFALVSCGSEPEDNPDNETVVEIKDTTKVEDKQAENTREDVRETEGGKEGGGYGVPDTQEVGR